MEADEAPIEDEAALPSSSVRVGFTIGEACVHYTNMMWEDEEEARF